MKNLFDFHESEVVQSGTSTHVVDEIITSSPILDFYKTPVYLATEQGFKNYCSTCPRLIRKEDLKTETWKYRVICSVPKCEK